MTTVYILLINFDNDGWETYSVSNNLEQIYEDAKSHAIFQECGKYTKYLVERWSLENSTYIDKFELDWEKI